MTATARTITLFRADVPESRHPMMGVVCDAAGTVMRAWGADPHAMVFPRSALKPLQALPLVESGAADAFAVSDEELALACASHNGLPMHVERVAAWLDRIGCTVDDLECGAHDPYDAGATRTIYEHHDKPSALHNNCSGKHTGMLTVCRHLGLPTKGYTHAHHPLQQRILTTYAETSGTPEAAMPVGIDGCSLPAAGMPLAGLATAMARFAAPDGQFAPARAEAARRLSRAWAAHPELVAGPNTFNTDAMVLTGNRVLLKRGAQGVYGGCVPEKGLGFAIKAESGNSVAADAMTAVVMRELGLVDDEVWKKIVDLPYFRETSWRGLPAGTYRPEDGWPA